MRAYENAARKVPFRRRASARIPSRKLLPLIALACSAALHAQSANAPVSKFLQLGEGERYWWYEGAFRAMGHLIATQDRQKGECVADWYLKDRTARRKIIEDTMAKYPGEGPTTVVLGLLTKACGELVPRQPR